jgi:hypothetical protein
MQDNKYQITFPYLARVEAHSLIVIIQSMGSVMVWAKLIQLNGFQYTVLAGQNVMQYEKVIDFTFFSKRF